MKKETNDLKTIKHKVNYSHLTNKNKMKVPDIIFKKLEELRSFGFKVTIREREKFIFICWRIGSSWSTGIIKNNEFREISTKSIVNRIQNEIDVYKSQQK